MAEMEVSRYTRVECGNIWNVYLPSTGTQEYFQKYAQGIIRVSNTFKVQPSC